MENIKNWNITEIENASENEISGLASEILNINGFTVYLVDFSGYFGYSAVVYGNGKQIKYANDYELHHKGKTKEELKQWYIETLNHKLFSDDQLNEKIKDYQDYNNKSHFIRNYYPLQFDYLSMFQIFHNEKEEKAFDRDQKKNYPYICAACFAYFKEKAISDKINDMILSLEYKLKELENDFEYWKSAIKYEMYNHEYCINWQGDFDVIGCFARVKWCGDCAGTDEFLKHSTLTDIQKKAYKAAKKEYFQEIGNDY